MCLRLHAIALLILSSQTNYAQQDFSDVEIKTTQIADNLYMLEGRGGNIGLLIGEDGVLMVDTQYAGLTPKINDAIKKLTEDKLTYVINTHWHDDHVGGNENYGKAGAIIVAHENARKRISNRQFMKQFQRQVEPKPAEAWPVITFTRDITFHFNGEEVRVIHVDDAHTDGDALIYFKNANAIHTGDAFVRYGFPFIDVSAGGSIDEIIEAQDQILFLMDDNTTLIPGHGQPAGKEAVEKFKDMLEKSRKKVKKQKEKGHALEEVLSKNPLKKFREDWEGDFIDANTFVTFIYETIE